MWELVCWPPLHATSWGWRSDTSILLWFSGHWSPFDLGSRTFPDHAAVSDGFVPWAAGEMCRHESHGFPSSTREASMAPCWFSALLSIPPQDARSTLPAWAPTAALHPKQWPCWGHRLWRPCVAADASSNVKNADIEISVLNQKHHAYKSGFSNTLPKCRCEVLLVYYIKIGSLDTNASAKSVCSHLWPEGTASWAGMLFWRNKELIAESLAVSQLCRRGRVVKSKSWS